MSKSPNRLLASLPSAVYSALMPHLKVVELKFGDVIAEAGSAIRQVYFPYSGVISLVVELKVGSMIETAMVGYDGVLNAAPALDEKVSLNKGIVQVAGSAGTIEANRLRRLANEFEPLRALLIRHEQLLFAQSQQSAACRSYGRGPHVPVATAYARFGRERRADADAGISCSDARRAAAKRVDSGEPAAESRPDQIQSRPHSSAGRRGAKEGSLRVLRDGQGALPAAPFGLEPISEQTAH